MFLILSCSFNGLLWMHQMCLFWLYKMSLFNFNLFNFGVHPIARKKEKKQPNKSKHEERHGVLTNKAKATISRSWARQMYVAKMWSKDFFAKFAKKFILAKGDILLQSASNFHNASFDVTQWKWSTQEISHTLSKANPPEMHNWHH